MILNKCTELHKQNYKQFLRFEKETIMYCNLNSLRLSRKISITLDVYHCIKSLITISPLRNKILKLDKIISRYK